MRGSPLIFLFEVCVNHFEFDFVVRASDQTCTVHAKIVIEFDDVAVGVFGGFNWNTQHFVPVCSGFSFFFLFCHSRDETSDVAELVGVGAAVECGKIGFFAVIDLVVFKESIEVIVKAHKQNGLGNV